MDITHAVGCADKRGEEMRLIDADALIAWIKGSQQMTSKMKCVIAKIETMPDAVSVVHGEWIRNFDGNEWFWYCSNCKTQYYEEDLWMGGNEFPNYCPNCGARMKGADDE